MKPTPPKKLKADSKYAMILARYPVRLLHDVTLGVLLGSILAIGLQSLPHDHSTTIVHVDEQIQQDPTPAPIPSLRVVASPGTENDLDGDGIPNDWEISHSHNPNYAADAASDFDSDGLTTLQEYELWNRTNGQAGNPLGKWTQLEIPLAAPEYDPLEYNYYYQDSYVGAANDAGDTVIQFYSGGERLDGNWFENAHAVFLHADGTQQIISIPGKSSGSIYASDINDRGDVLIQWYSDNWSITESYILKSDKSLTQLTLHGNPCLAYRMNNFGDWIGYEITTSGEWKSVQVVDGVNVLPNEIFTSWYYFLDINDYGQAIGSYYDVMENDNLTFTQLGSMFFSTGRAGDNPTFNEATYQWQWPAALNQWGEFAGGAYGYMPNGEYRNSAFFFDGSYHDVSPQGNQNYSWAAGLSDSGMVLLSSYSYAIGKYTSLLWKDSVSVNCDKLMPADTLPSDGSFVYPTKLTPNGKIYLTRYDANWQPQAIITLTPNQDADGDGMPDDWEEFYGFNSYANDAFLDYDNDGTSNLGEFLLRSDPHNPPVFDPNGNVIDTRPGVDTDGDGVPNNWEYVNGMNYQDPADAPLDFDRDGYTNLQEFRLNTDPRGAPSYRISKLGPFSGTSSVDLSNATLGNGVVSGNPTYFSGDQVTEQVFFSTRTNDGLNKPAVWSQERSGSNGQFAFFTTYWDSNYEIVAQSPSGALLTRHGYPFIYTYWSSPSDAPTQLTALTVITELTGGADDLYNVTFSPSGNYLFAVRYRASDQSYEPIVWKMPSPGNSTYDPVVLTSPAGSSFNAWTSAYINDYGIIVSNGTVEDQNRPLAWSFDESATTLQGSILQTLPSGSYATVVGLSNHSLPIIAGTSTNAEGQERATVWKYNNPTAITASDVGTLKNGNYSQISKISPNGTLAGMANTLANDALEYRIFSAAPVIPAEASSIDPSLYSLTPQEESSNWSNITDLVDSGELLATTYDPTTYQAIRSLTRHGRSHSLEEILPPSSGYTLDSIKSINAHGTLLVTAWKDNLLETLLLTPDQDTDGDGLPDAFENANQFNAFVKNNPATDTDNDGLTDLQEFANGTNPRLADTDSDGMQDGWEISWGLNPLDATDANLDPDGDRVTNLRESQIGTYPTGIYKVEIRLTDTEWQNPAVTDVSDDGSIIHTGQNLYDSGTTPDGMQNWYSWSYSYFTLPASFQAGTPSISLSTYHYNQYYNDDWSNYAGSWESPDYHFDASTGAIIADIQRGSYTFDGANWNSSETPFLISDILTHSDESSWNSWDSIQNNLITSGALEENEILYPSSICISPNGRHRIYATSNGRQIHLNEKGELVEVLPYNDGWTHINNDGVLIRYENEYVEETSDTPAHYLPKIIAYRQEYGYMTYDLTATSEVSAILNYPSIIQFSDDQKILLSQYDYANGTSRQLYYLADLTTHTLKKVKSPGLGNEYITHLSTTNGRMVGNGTKPWQITPDGTCIRLEALRVQNSLSGPQQTLKSLYPQAINPVHIAPDGSITATTYDSQSHQQIIRITLENDLDHDGIADDVERYVASYLIANNVVNNSTQNDLLEGDLNINVDYTGDGLTAVALSEIIISSNSNTLVDDGSSNIKDELEMEFEFLEQHREAFIARGSTQSGEVVGFFDSFIGEGSNLIWASIDAPEITAQTVTNAKINQLLDQQSPWNDEFEKKTFAELAYFMDHKAEKPEFGWDVCFQFSQKRVKIAVKSLSQKERKIHIIKITRGRVVQEMDYALHRGSTPTPWVDVSSEVIEMIIPANKLISTEWKLIEPKAQPGMRFVTTIEPFIINSADKYLCGNLQAQTLGLMHWYNGMNENQTLGIIFKNKQSGEEYRFDDFEDVFVYDKGLTDELLEEDALLSEAEVAMDAESPQLRQNVVFYRKNDKIHFRALFNTPGKIEIGLLYNGQEMTGPSSDSNGDPLPPGTSGGGIQWELHADDNLGGLIDKLDAILSNTWSDNRLDQQLQSALYHGASDEYLEQLMLTMNPGPTGPVVGDSGHPRLTAYQHRNLVIKIMMPVWVQLDHCYQKGQMVNFEEGMILAAKGLIAMLKGYAEGMWIGLKSDLEGVRDTVVGLYKLVTEPRECARSLKESFSAMRDMTMDDWKNMAKKLVDDFLTKAEKQLPWTEPTGFLLVQYVVGFSAGYLAEQIAVGIATAGASKAAGAGKFGTIIADLVKIARGLKQGAIKAAGGAMKKAKTALFRWQSQFVNTEDAMRYLRKISDYSYKDYLPDCPGLLTP
jgi:Bacterial TSP3 repeat